ncbi:Uncharacterized conserved protein YbjT, contains NAD(P)-binding and DUF2867 domains [Amycolatopsis arida]|uniref:Uncharacterized conserved protein YbjT, contains NAD(P)-binding and DUF2867 domains n=1 Tax=Amycolatopsis arida TaxID=587909 RepID=A0A1I5LS91_9PSEU|nr:NAD(P)H-binding protein [Amycolatopsis arida]TDX93827.1 uncharacterized protein YbjT (DUF2867 family) [Amycolatopsis arida]SFP00234.1 Uncharacterized conserved protein YbjT, contains NAD(P)-binding and DUF2867 domains [Amycolatopsis arida]
MTEQRTIVVTGATGNVGRQVVERLRNTGVRVRALVRAPEKADLPGDVERVRGDLSRPETLGPAVAGADGVFLIWPFLDSTGAEAVVREIARNARRVVYLSSLGVRDDQERQGDPINQFHADLERLIRRQDGLEWTFLRPCGFAVNTLGWAEQIRAGDEVRGPFGTLSSPLIHEADMAAVAVRALTEDGHAGKVHRLTGPERLPVPEQVRIIGEEIGRPLRFVETSVEQARRDMLDHGWPAELVDAVLEGQATMRDVAEPVTTTVAEVTGRPARTFREWVRDHRADFQPSASTVST